MRRPGGSAWRRSPNGFLDALALHPETRLLRSSRCRATSVGFPISTTDCGGTHMFTKNFLFSILRLALLSLVLMFTGLALTILAGAPSATAQTSCTPGQTRTI